MWKLTNSSSKKNLIHYRTLSVIQCHTFLFSLKASINIGILSVFLAIIQAMKRTEILFFRGLYQIVHSVLSRFGFLVVTICLQGFE